MVRKIQFEVGALAAVGVAALALLVSSTAVSADELDQMVAQRMDVNAAGATSQKKMWGSADGEFTALTWPFIASEQRRGCG